VKPTCPLGGNGCSRQQNDSNREFHVRRRSPFARNLSNPAWNRKRLFSFFRTPVPNLPGVYSNQETKMRNLLIAACCAALMGSVSIASAQTTAPAAQDSMKTDNPMNANAKMKKKKSSKKTTKSDDSMKSDAPKDSK
jgi:hypothetical protein